MKTDNNIKTENILDKSMLAARILFFAVLAAILIVLAIICSQNSLDPLTYDDPTPLDTWTVTNPDGSVVSAGRDYRNSDFHDVFTATTILPDNIKEDSYFVVIVGGDISVYVNDELRKEFNAKRDFSLPGGVAKRFYYVVPISTSDSGAELKLVRYNTTRKGNVYQNAMLATSSGLYNYLMKSYSFTFMIAELLAIFSLVAYIISVVLRMLYKRRIAMMYGSFSIVILSSWVITNSYLFPFIYHQYHVDGILNYMLCMLIPFCLLFYLDILQKGRYRKAMIAMAALSFVSFFAWSVLHFTSIFAFYRSLIYIDIILGIQILFVFACLFIDLLKKKVKEYKYSAIGFMLFMVCGFAEIIMLNFFNTLHDEVPMLLGLASLLTMAVVQQIDDIKKINDERIRAISVSKAKSKFLASMSHEIRTPINAIMGMNEMILRENEDPRIEEYATSVKSSGKMLLMLVNDVLDFSKIEAGKMVINYSEYSFSNLLRDIFPMLKERADEKKIDLKIDFLRKIPAGHISDEFRIKQILINLINNAIKYTDSGSVILFLDAEQVNDKKYILKMSVKDTGRGISEEGQKNLFDAFTRADLKKNGDIEGTGLGLAIVKSIIDSMNGEINVTSKLGEGSEFSVKLPMEIYDETPVKEDFMSSAKREKVQKKESEIIAPDAKILTVDDNSSNLRIVSLFLKRLEIVPDACDSGKKAIELCKEKKYDLILMDHMMPDIDGLETLEAIRNDESSKNRDTLAIVLTANAIQGSRAKYEEAGFVDYLSKPLDSSLLEKTVLKHLPREKIKKSQDKKTEKTNIKKSVEERLKSIEGLDYDTAMRYTGYEEEMLDEVVSSIEASCDSNIAKLRKCLSEGNMDDYSTVAHSIKGLMATIGLDSFREKAKKHEDAGAEKNIDFINENIDAFCEEYRNICDRMVGKK